MESISIFIGISFWIVFINTDLYNRIDLLALKGVAVDEGGSTP